MPEYPAVIVGAGLAGLSCAHVLGPRCLIVEREDRVGGLCRTLKAGGFTADITGHYLHFADETSKRFALGLLGGNVLERARDSRVYLRGKEGAYPFQTHTHGHVREVVRECVLGLFRTLERETETGSSSESYADWVFRTQGDGFARRFMLPFNRKQFRVPMSRLTPEQGGRFVPRPRPEDVVRGALGLSREVTGYNSRIWYPRRGGIESLPRALAAGLRTRPVLRTEANRIRWRSREIRVDTGTTLPYTVLVYTGSLPELLARLDPQPPAMVAMRRRLRWIGVLTLHFLMARASNRRTHWVYVPERRYAFYRYGYPSNINRTLAPAGMGILSAEVSYLPGRRPAVGVLMRRVKRDLVRIGALRRTVGSLATDAPVAYVLFDRQYRQARHAALRFLAKNGILAIGRYGGWKYGGMCDAIREGLEAGAIIKERGGKSGLAWLRKLD